MKLSLEALKDRAEATASMDLLATISGGTDNACHDTYSSGCTGVTPSELAAALEQYAKNMAAFLYLASKAIF